MGIFQQKYITEKEDTTTAEHSLWISVLTKAAHDAIYTSDWIEARKAMDWFKDMGPGFREVCELAGRDPNYVHNHIIDKILKREKYMVAVKTGNRIYLKEAETEGPHYHSHYRGGRLGKKRGPYKKTKHLTGNAYYKAQREKNPIAVLRGSKGGRPRMYDR